MRANKNSSQRNKVRKQDALLQNQPQKKRKKQKDKKKTNQKVVSLRLLRKKLWNNSTQEVLHRLEAQNDYKNTANCH